MGPGRWGSRGDIKLGVPRHLFGHQQHRRADRDRPQEGQLRPGAVLRHPFLPGPGRVVDPLPAALSRRPGHRVQRDVPARRAKLPARHPARVRPPWPTPCTSSTCPSATGGKVLRVLMNADLDEAVGFLATPVRRTAAAEDGDGAVRDRQRGPLALAAAHGRAHGRPARPRALRRQGHVRVRQHQERHRRPGQRHRPAGPFPGHRRRRRSELVLWLEGWSLCLAEINLLAHRLQVRRPARLPPASPTRTSPKRPATRSRSARSPTPPGF